MKNKKALQAFICTCIATGLALTTHIYVAEWMKPFLDKLIAAQGGIPSTIPSLYPPIIIFSAYATAFLLIGFLVFLYYHTQHLIKAESRLTKILLVTCILFGFKGDLIRQPIMNFILMHTSGFNNAFLYVILDNIDKWIANLFLATCLVYLCPYKNKIGS
jgi:hypothetical protein